MYHFHILSMVLPRHSIVFTCIVIISKVSIVHARLAKRTKCICGGEKDEASLTRLALLSEKS